MIEKTPIEFTDSESAQKVSELFRTEHEKQVDALQEALHIEQIENRLLAYVKKDIITLAMPLEQVLEILEKRKDILIGNDEEDSEA
ncbi:MAG: hypothetical protein Q8Q39_03220 [bacterium]|nr:hypothetical protein [bacterium]